MLLSGVSTRKNLWYIVSFRLVVMHGDILIREDKSRGIHWINKTISFLYNCYLWQTFSLVFMCLEKSLQYLHTLKEHHSDIWLVSQVSDWDFTMEIY